MVKSLMFPDHFSDIAAYLDLCNYLAECNVFTTDRNDIQNNSPQIIANLKPMHLSCGFKVLRFSIGL